MIESVKLKNFKCFRDQTISMRNLTVLSGLNGMGKSSFVQSLLLLQQSYESGDLAAGRLSLSGELVDLGTGADLLFDLADEEVVEIHLDRGQQSGKESQQFRFDYDRASDLLIDVPKSTATTLEVVRPFPNGFRYLTAERLGPRKSLPLSESRVLKGDIGVRGEYVLHFLLKNESSKLGTNDPRGRSAPTLKLSDQVDAWLQDISPGSHFDAEMIRAADIGIAGYRFDRVGDVLSPRFRATNVGFGLSYVLPVIVALLDSSSGSVLIVENPEAHLHPKGQTRLGQLAALAASAGVQVICETHSDHFLDGIRIEVRKGLLAAEKTAIHYFSRKGTEVTVKSPEMTQDGRLSEWPLGFFDQHDENLAFLIAPRG